MNTPETTPRQIPTNSATAPGIDPVSSEALSYVVGLLPSEFQGVSFIAQWSSSAGLKPGLIKVHLWYWLETPLGSRDLRAWAKGLAPLIDPAPFNAVQPHYTARPIFDGLPDPVQVRTLLVELQRASVTLVVQPVPAPVIEWDQDVVDIVEPYFLFFLRCSSRLGSLARKPMQSR